MTNEERAAKGEAAIAAYVGTNTGAYPHEPDEAKLGDLLCDLRHWAKAQDVDFDAANDTGEMNFEAEIEEEDDDTAECSDCATMVHREDPYFATPCGTFCSSCMRDKHAPECGICASEFEIEY